MCVTIVASSGDDGASYYFPTTSSCLCKDYTGSSSYNPSTVGSWSGNGYFPVFPASCPYVTAVGATMGPNLGNEEVVCQSQLGGAITSGGGFSAYYARPSWQTDAVSAYFAQVSPASGYNPSGRGYPDVALIGVQYEVVIQNTMQSLYGTSCSTPVFAAMITLINTARLEKNLSSIGFINPTLYSAGMNQSIELFNDVTSGNNSCCADRSAGGPTCCKAGFRAASGWDPVSGWGSVKYPDLLKLFSVGTPYYPSSSGSSHKSSSLSTRVIFLLVVSALFLLS